MSDAFVPALRVLAPVLCRGHCSLRGGLFSNEQLSGRFNVHQG
jgi:hypothetical protein